ncbi:MAG: M3 family oligoendopeptidase [Rickettsiales bacterium]|nr:M3 family oligoendopeptidase [Rickettsiales bacterium]
MTNLGKVPNWNLEDFYKNIEDPQIKKDLNNLDNKTTKFAKEYEGNVTKLNAKELFKAISVYEIISENIGKISSYAYLVYASNLSDQKNISFYQNISEKLNSLSTKLVFFTLEINKISDINISKLLKDKNLVKYQPFLRDVRSFKKHELSNELEKFNIDKNITGRNAFIRLFDETANNLEFSYDKKILNSQEIFDLLSNKDEKIRKKAAKSIGATFEKNIKTFAFITNILAKDKEISDKYRGFQSPISSRNLSNFIEDDVVETLITEVKENYKNISHRYYKIKAKMLGQTKLNYWDRNAPLSSEEKLTTFTDAKNLVLEAYGEFNPKMREIGEIFFKQNWIDAKVAKGKDSGAFSHPTTPSLHPYILMNYQGKVRDIMTLAHELGHGVHQYLARKQGYLMADTPLTLAETASVFGEQLTFQKILKNEKDEKKKKLIIANKVEDMINTVVRQIAFLEFEKKVHENRKNGELSLDQINTFWMDVQKDSLGDVFKYDEEYKYFWCYIPHFIHSPFYVYSYAFGDCLVNSLYGIYKSNTVKDFENKYIKMLESGGTKHHKDLLKPFNLDISTPTFWQAGLDVIIDYINQLEK